MGIFKLKPGTEHPAPETLNGREYFREAERELGIEDADPDAVSETAPELPAPSPLGGDLTHRDTTQLDDSETKRRELASEEFLKQPAVHFPAEELETK